MIIKISATKLCEIDSDSKVWVASYMDEKAGYKTKLLNVIYDFDTEYYYFEVEPYIKRN